jgi:hypothetical protein
VLAGDSGDPAGTRSSSKRRGQRSDFTHSDRRMSMLVARDTTTRRHSAGFPQREHPTSPLPDRRWLGLSTASASLRDERPAARVLTTTSIASRRLTGDRPAVERVARARRCRRARRLVNRVSEALSNPRRQIHLGEGLPESSTLTPAANSPPGSPVPNLAIRNQLAPGAGTQKKSRAPGREIKPGPPDLGWRNPS